ncbi:roadblock/LC7 domain-containing protein [Microcystis aeruginosa]|jgi:predicted regulator of Ras-like GTPase activity (Roadblock/LC7/MglB family)|uniref:roadblock/LC7 domain-containing protein n=1 Tax=Microcystis aeruginosa TaxID=1126 RepID=UPI001E40D817|nr:roadblock/LC7 domain-containing protein [Microcystis aeruginosa]
MSFIVEQLIYSSFSQLGFKYIAGANVPLGIQEVFYQHIVSQLWDNYNPPDGNFKGVYVHQIDSHNTLFGWLINDGKDEFGRGDIPYFHCYYLQELLDSKQLVKILACLEAGPLKRISRDEAEISLDTVVLADNYHAKAFELGIKLSKDIRLFSHRQLREEKPLQWFISSKETKERQHPTDNNYDNSKNTLPREPNYQAEVAKILQELAEKPLAIEAIMLVSPQGQPLTDSSGMEQNSALILAGTMLYLANNTKEELSWSDLEQIAIRSPQGHLILTPCSDQAFLLVKTGKTITGLLEGEIEKTRSKLAKILAISHPIPQTPLL